MLNRALQVKMIKMDDSVPGTAKAEPSPELASIISYTIDRSIERIGIAVCAYVVLDTVRQVVVAKANR